MVFRSAVLRGDNVHMLFGHAKKKLNEDPPALKG